MLVKTKKLFLSNLSKECGRQGLDYADLAVRIGMPLSTFYKKTGGTSAIKFDFIDKIAAALSVPVYQLFMPIDENEDNLTQDEQALAILTRLVMHSKMNK